MLRRMFDPGRAVLLRCSAGWRAVLLDTCLNWKSDMCPPGDSGSRIASVIWCCGPKPVESDLIKRLPCCQVVHATRNCCQAVMFSNNTYVLIDNAARNLSKHILSVRFLLIKSLGLYISKLFINSGSLSINS